MNSDASVRAIKGAGRPVNSERDRAVVQDVAPHDDLRRCGHRPTTSRYTPSIVATVVGALAFRGHVFDSGLAVVRDARCLREAMSGDAAYLQRGQRDPGFLTPGMSTRARGAEIWAALASLGRSGLADLVERTCRHAQRFADGLHEAGFEILNDVVINQVLVSFGDDETTRRVIAGIQEEGTCWCGGTVWHDRAAMRISVSGWATTDGDVDRSLEAMIRIASETKLSAAFRS